MSNSSLINYKNLSPNHSGTRNHKIDTVSIHCMAGNLSVERCGELFANPNTQASSNYGIGSDGRIALYVEEKNRSWCTSSAANDNRAVTIEVANTTNYEPYPISTAAYNICKRNGIPQLLWKGDKSLIGNVSKQNMTVHRWFANKSCPGDWLYQHHGQIAADANKLLKEEDDDMKYYEKVSELPSWAKPTIQKVIDKGVLKGDGSGLHLSEDNMKMFIYMDRLGLIK